MQRNIIDTLNKSGMRRTLKLFLIILVLFILAACSGGTAFTCLDEIIVVNQTTDLYTSSCTDSYCTLRDAVALANACQISDSSWNGAIELPAGRIELTLRGGDDNRGDIDIRSNVTIQGTLSGRSIVVGQSSWIYRIFEIHPGYEVAFQHFDVMGGNTSEIGGGIYNAGNTAIWDMLIQDNEAGTSGGGIANSGDLLLTAVEINNNNAEEAYSWGCGGGIFNTGVLRLDFTNIQANGAYHGPGICNRHPGSIFASDVDISNNGATVAGVSGLGGGISSISSGLVHLENTHIHHNHSRYGGGIYLTRGTLEMVFSTISQNRASQGGGLFLGDSGNLHFETTSVFENEAFTLIGRDGTETGGQGGGVYLASHDYDFFQSPIYSNIAERMGGGVFVDAGVHLRGFFSHAYITHNESQNGAGGGIYVNRGDILIANTTLSHNRAVAHGITLYNAAEGEARLVHVTIADSVGPGGISDTYDVMNEEGGLVTFRNSLLDGYGDASCFGDGSYASEGGNYATFALLCGMTHTTDIGVLSFPIGGIYLPLTELDGTFVHPLIPGSPAVEHIAFSRCNDDDQRGFDRLATGTGCDIGAYELDLTGLSADPPTDLVIPTPTDTPSSPLLDIPAIIISNARCRFGPDSVYEDYDFFSTGDQSTVSGRNVDASWLYISALNNGGKCWIGRNVLQFEVADEVLMTLPEITPPPTPTPTPQATATSQPSGGGNGNAPAAPQQPYYDNWVCSQNGFTFTLHWIDAATNESGYRILLGNSELATLGENVDKYSVSAAFGGPYTYTIQSFNGNGSASATVDVPGCIP